jgi:hypothetical protein
MAGAIVSAMSEPLIDVVAAPDHLGVARWLAVAPPGSVVGVAGLGRGAAELCLHVVPQWRRRGIGSRLLAAVQARAGEPRLVAVVAERSPGEAFCLRHGFRHTGSRRHDLLANGDLHPAWLGELVDAEHPGYRLTHWTGDLRDTHRAVLTAADANGRLAAYAVAVVDPLSRPRARQYGPAVLPDHRGRRLDLWVNAALIQRLGEVDPYVDEIEAVTAEDDPDLLAARRQLGFRPTRRYEWDTR